MPAEAHPGPVVLTVLPPGGDRISDDCDYVYAPTHPDRQLDADALANAALGLACRRYDFLLFSRSLSELPRLAAPTDVRQSVVFAAALAPVFLKGEPPPRALRGRLVRGPGLRDGSPAIGLDALLPGARISDRVGEIEWGEGTPPSPPVLDCSGLRIAEVPASDRPRVFVWPAMWAVGGAERNAIEIMRELRDRYDFIVVTTERLTEAMGSLHHQLKGLATATYDLAEVGGQPEYVSMLSALKRTWDPDLVWITNGSPWQSDHAIRLRALFEDVPIVDQQVYDAKAGWINRYHEPGIQSFDRFVAINQRIRQEFEGRLRIDPARVDLIYHAFDSARFRPAADPEASRAAARTAWGLPLDRPMFLFVGRMTPQKRPFDFIELARRATAGGVKASFVMLGDGDLAGEVDARIGRLPGCGLRRLPFTDKVPEVLAASDGLVITSEYEGLPIAMLEALAVGLPVLSTDVGDVGLVLEEYGAGVVVPEIGDVEALLRAFRPWSAELDRYREAALRSAPRIADRFSPATIAGQYDACWSRARQDRPRARN